MKSVTVLKSILLSHLKSNREKHIVEFQEAMAAYRVKMQETIRHLSEKAHRNEDISHSIDVVRPISYVSSYDEAISMLEWGVDKEVTLDRNEFKQYVQDEWAWKGTFEAMASSYKAR